MNWSIHWLINSWIDQCVNNWSASLDRSIHQLYKLYYLHKLKKCIMTPDRPTNRPTDRHLHLKSSDGAKKQWSGGWAIKFDTPHAHNLLLVWNLLKLIRNLFKHNKSISWSLAALQRGGLYSMVVCDRLTNLTQV